MIVRQSIVERILARCEERPGPLATPCLIWTGALTKAGYGEIKWEYGNPKVVLTHRVLWEAVNGLVPEGLELDHLCRVHPCCRESHLEAVTKPTNILRGAMPWMYSGFCARNHLLPPRKPGAKQRDCATCRADAARVTYHYLRGQGYSAKDASALSGRSEHRRAAGVILVRGA